MNGMEQLKVNELELHARTYAVAKAREVCGEIVQLVLDRTQAELPRGLGLMEHAEAHLERRLAALLKNSLVDFTERYVAELERRCEALLKVKP